VDKISKDKTVMTVVVVALIAAGAGFFGGMKYQQGKTSLGFPTTRMGQGGPGGTTGTTQGKNGTAPGGNMGGGSNRPVFGEITAVDDSSITIKSTDGSSSIVMLSGSTAIYKMAQSTKEELKIGEKVNVIGTGASDGTVNATSIELGTVGQGGPTQ